MTLLPRIGVSETTLCFDWGEAEGRLLFFSWGPLHLEVSIAWRSRTVGQDRPCLVCERPTSAVALFSDDDGQTSIITICEDCQQLADDFGIGGKVNGGAA